MKLTRTLLPRAGGVEVMENACHDVYTNFYSVIFFLVLEIMVQAEAAAADGGNAFIGKGRTRPP